MKNGTRILTLTLLCFFCLAQGQNKDSLRARAPAVADTLRKATDTRAAAVADTAKRKADSLSAPILTPVAPPAPKKISLVKRTYNGRQQIMLACGMMIFVVGMFTAAQNWNPR